MQDERRLAGITRISTPRDWSQRKQCSRTTFGSPAAIVRDFVVVGRIQIQK